MPFLVCFTDRPLTAVYESFLPAYRVSETPRPRNVIPQCLTSWCQHIFPFCSAGTVVYYLFQNSVILSFSFGWYFQTLCLHCIRFFLDLRRLYILSYSGSNLFTMLSKVHPISKRFLNPRILTEDLKKRSKKFKSKSTTHILKSCIFLIMLSL